MEQIQEKLDEIIEQAAVKSNPLEDHKNFLKSAIVGLSEATITADGMTKIKLKKDRRLKLYIKLDQHNSEQFEKIASIFKASGAVSSNDEVAKTLLLAGLASTIDQFTQQLEALESEQGSTEADNADSSD